MTEPSETLSRASLLALLKQAPAAIAIMNGQDLRFELANEPYQKLVGRDETQLLGKPLKTAFPEISPEILRILQDVVLSGKCFEASEFPITLDWTATGTPTVRFLNFIYAPYCERAEITTGVMVFAFDVTEQVTARKRASASEAQLRLITDSLPSLISYMDLSGRYLFVNHAYSKWFGKPRAEIEGKTRKQLVANDTTYRYMQPFESQAFAGKAASFELTLTKDGGEFVNLATNYLPDINPETGQVRGVIGLGHDVTKMRQTLKEVEQLASELTAAISTRDEFMSIASHELKTPITSLRLQLQMMQRRLKADSHSGKFTPLIDASIKQVDRLTDLVESLLDVTRIQAGRIEYSFSEFDLRALIDDVIERFSGQLEDAQSPIHLELEKNITVNWDRSRIEQVVVNLVSNAIKYAPGKTIRIHAMRQGEMAVLAIQDSGPGIAQERQAKIFERFERATASRNISGLGLGLFIVKQIVIGHHGQIRVESAPGEGTKFTVEIPIHPERSAPAPDEFSAADI